jgi:hypothetical protein
MKNLKIHALAAVIVFLFASCGTAGKNVSTFLDGSWWNTGENANCRMLIDGNTWTYYINNSPVYKGTWTSSVPPDADAKGTITFTITQVEMRQGWVGLSAAQKKIKSCTVKYSIDADGKQITLSEKQLAAADPEGLWSKLEGVYIKGGRSGGRAGSGGASGGNAAPAGSKTGDGSASQAAKNASKNIVEEKPYIPYVITGSGTSFTAIRNGTSVIRANQTITDLINAIVKDSAGSNASIQFGNGVSILDIGSASLRFDHISDGNGGVIALSGKIITSASPAIAINSTVVTSTADISTTGSSGSIIDNKGTVIINGGTVTSNSANIYGINNNGGTVIINNGNISPRGEAIHNDSGSGRGGNVTIYGGTVHSLSGRAITNMKGSTVTINGGTVSTSFSETIYNPGGSLKITGGTVSGGSSSHAISNADSGNITMTGGTVSLTNISGSYAAISNNSGCTLTISGGTVLAPNGGKAVINASGGTADITSPPAVIKGSVQNQVAVSSEQ